MFYNEESKDTVLVDIEKIHLNPYRHIENQDTYCTNKDEALYKARLQILTSLKENLEQSKPREIVPEPDEPEYTTDSDDDGEPVREFSLDFEPRFAEEKAVLLFGGSEEQSYQVLPCEGEETSVDPFNKTTKVQLEGGTGYLIPTLR